MLPGGQRPAPSEAAKTAEARPLRRRRDDASIRRSRRPRAIAPTGRRRPPSRADEVEAVKKERRATPNHIVGTFRRTAGGFGFVRPEGTQRAEGRDADIFIPANNTGDAASGDIVSVRLESQARPHAASSKAAIIDVVDRATNHFVGTYFEQAGMGMVQIDGKLFTQPIYVGDPGAKGVQPDDKVVIEMVRFPSHAHDGEGVIVEVLGTRGQPGVDTLSIIHEFNLPGRVRRRRARRRPPAGRDVRRIDRPTAAAI